MDCIYFIYAPHVNKVKIGVTNDLDRRMAAIQSMSPVDIVCIGTIDSPPYKQLYSMEAKLHKKFRMYRSHGEWFNCFGGLEDYLQTFYQIKRYKMNDRTSVYIQGK